MKLLIVDDHPLFRDGLAALLRQASRRHGRQCRRPPPRKRCALVDEQIFDAVFMDLVMPGCAANRPSANSRAAIPTFP